MRKIEIVKNFFMESKWHKNFRTSKKKGLTVEWINLFEYYSLFIYKNVVQAWNFNFPTWKGKTIPFWPHKHRQCGKNGIVFLFQVGKLKFLACTARTSLVRSLNIKLKTFELHCKFLQIRLVWLGTIQILRNQDFGLLGPHPPTL